MTENTQSPVKPDRDPAGSLLVHSIFPTIQGEGPFAGTPAVFVRLAGCNLQCRLCDTEYTAGAKRMSPDTILTNIIMAAKAGGFDFRRGRFLIGCDAPLKQGVEAGTLVVITGGEPFRQNLVPFTKRLLAERLRVQVETNGTLWSEEPLPGAVTLVCSPKTGRIHQAMMLHAHAFKFVVQDGKVGPDGFPLSVLGMANPAAAPDFALCRRDVEVYIQPLDEQDAVKNEANTKLAVNICLAKGYRLCLQTHKLVNLP